eukprot:17907-Heterococcus_DN1.PRE.1
MDFADKTASPQQVHSPKAAPSRQRQLSQPQAWQQQLRAPWEGSYTPLTHDGITFDVLSYLGVREWLFIALTSQRWRQLYAAVVTAENAACGEPGAPVAFTSRAAAFESATRLQIAIAAGLPLASTGTAASFRDLSREQYLAGRYGSCDALALAHKLGLPWTEQYSASCSRTRLAAAKLCVTVVARTLRASTKYRRALCCCLCAVQHQVCHGAAASGDLAKLQWLRLQQQCPWDDERIASHAAESGSIAMLQWLKQQPSVVFNCWACRSALPFFDVSMYLDRE